ncbi:MAG: hypothetical protein PWR10_2208 [Halanaerobiales bacterium]|nr:hypothetical protein [Halanaerobiales bacterium]
MPKDTFFNLSESKRGRVVAAAIDEFASYPFHKASVTRIIKKAGIASGSFYQYFEDKKDLYMYIIKLIGDKKMEYLNYVLQRFDSLDFFQMLRELYLAGIRFARDNPKLDAIGNNLIKNSDQLYKDIIGDQKPMAIHFFEEMLQKGIEKGGVDPAIDTRLVAEMLLAINLSISELIYEDGQVNMNDMELIDKMLYVIENGIRKKR